MTTYIALLRKDPDSDYGVDFPDFPGCITAGSTLEEARVMAAEALAGHIAGMMEDRLPIPEPSALEAIMADPHNSDAVGFLVDMPIKPVRDACIDVMLPEDLLRAIDAAASDRSQFLADAAREKLRASG